MSQGEQLEALCALLGEETRVCGVLSGVLRDEQTAAIGLDPDGIIGCLAERRLLHEQFVQLAAARRDLVYSIAREQGETAERVTELLPLLAADAQDADLVAVIARLTQTQTALQAALAAGAEIARTSLADLLKL